MAECDPSDNMSFFDTPVDVGAQPKHAPAIHTGHKHLGVSSEHRLGSPGRPLIWHFRLVCALFISDAGVFVCLASFSHESRSCVVTPLFYCCLSRRGVVLLPTKKTETCPRQFGKSIDWALFS